MKGTKATLLVEKLRGYVCHEHLWVVNGEGLALRHPVDIKLFKIGNRDEAKDITSTLYCKK